MDWNNLKADYERLGTYKAVAAEYGVSVSTVGQHARKMGINRGYGIQDSPLEKLLQAALVEVGIGFTTQAYLLHRYRADVLINQAPVIIEADGHWHKIHKDKDAERDALLTKSGYHVFRFTGADLNRDARGCVALVIDKCSLVPDEDPQFVYRASMMGEENPNWTGGKVSSSCTQCGKETPARGSRYNRITDKKFCNAKCYGAWMSDHPEYSPRKLKIDWTELPGLYSTGVTIRELQEKYNCSRNTILRQLRRMGVEPNRDQIRKNRPRVYKVSEEHRDALIAARRKQWDEGYTRSRGNDGRFL